LLPQGGRGGQRLDHAEPEEATTKQELWTSIPKEVLYLYFGRGGFLTLDATIKPKWVEVLKYDASVLQKMGIIKQVDVEGVIDDRFVRQAYRELGRDYAKDQKVMAAGHLADGGQGRDYRGADQGSARGGRAVDERARPSSRTARSRR